ncbi:MAG: class I SAM-dependent methyltransferase [Gaiellaceae bacterium]
MEPTEHNLQAWERAHPRPGPEERTPLPARVLDRLPRVEGRHVLHLGCGEGDQTLELTDLGALVTGLDPFAPALARAQSRNPAVAWVHAPLDELPLELRRGRFDLVYMGEGALARVTDIGGWAGGIGSALRPGGGLVLFDVHPARRCLDAILHWREDYFAGTTSDGGRLWQLSEIVMALLATELHLRTLEELPGAGAFTRFEQRVPAELLILAERAL